MELETQTASRFEGGLGADNSGGKGFCDLECDVVSRCTGGNLPIANAFWCRLYFLSERQERMWRRAPHTCPKIGMFFGSLGNWAPVSRTRLV